MGAARFSLLCVTLLIACDSPGPHAWGGDTPIGKMQVAIGGDVREVAFSRAQCDPEGDQQRIELFYVRDVPDSTKKQRPRVLIARLRGDGVTEASAFMPQAQVGSSEYDMLMFIADPAQCRAERTGADITIACNNTTVVPWLDPGERPTPSFKATFRCE